MIVLDTNVVSELMKSEPDSTVLSWVRRQRPRRLATTAVTLAEVLYGIETLPHGRRRNQLREVATEVFGAFEEQVLPFDAEAAAHYPTIVAGRDRLGAPSSGFDAQIASICRSRTATLATRNHKDFQHLSLDLVDPWQVSS